MSRGLVFALAISLAAAAPARAADLNVSPVFVDFGRVKIGTTVTVRVTFDNLTASQLQLAGGSGLAAPFFYGPGTCGLGIVPASSSCYISYSFRPADNTEVVHEDEIGLTVSGGSAPGPIMLRFRGRGTGNLADVAFTAVDFGDWFVGELASVRLRIVNTHGAGLSIAGGGFNTSNGFGATGCGANPIPSGATCDLTYSFLPPATGFRENQTSFSLTTADTPTVSQYFPVHVQGTGIATVPLVGVAPIDVDFGNVTIGRQPVVQVKYTSFEAGAVSLSGGGFNDNDGAFWGYGGTGDVCTSATLPAGETCWSDYSFRPIEERDFAAVTTIGFSAPPDYQSSPLSFTGTGVGTLAQVSPVQIDFGDVEPGTNMTVPVVITNTSEATLTSFVGGGVLSPFSLVSNTCGASLAVGASCQFNYRFNSPNANPATAQTLLSFTNSSGIQPTFQIGLYANGAPEPGGLALGATALATLAVRRRRAARYGSGSAVAKRLR